MRRAFRTAFFTVFGLSLGLGLGTGERLFVQMAIVMMVACAVLAAHILYTVVVVIIRQELSAPEAVKGGELQLVITAHNETFVPVAPIDIAYHTVETLISGAPRYATLFPAPLGQDAISDEIACPYRGEYSPGIVTVSVQDALGIFHLTIRAEKLTHIKPIHLLIRPRVIPLPKDAIPLNPREGLHDQSMDSADDVTAVADVRRFRPGDALKRTHWKLSARLQETMIKQFDGTSVRDLAIIMDVRPPFGEGELKLAAEDALVEAGVSLAQLSSRGVPIKLIAYGRSRVEVRASRPIDFTAVYELLSRADFNGKYSVSDILALEITSRAGVGGIAVVTPDLGDALFDALLTMRENGHTLMLVCIKAHGDRDILFTKKLAELKARGARVVALAPGETLASAMSGRREAVG